MICLCSCKGSSASIEYQTASVSCRSCGGKVVDGLHALSGNMLSTMGLELSGVVDPHLNWSTATKGRQRARRARTSLTGGNRKKLTPNNSTVNQDAMNKGIEGTEDLIGSDSEKVGVSILGRRFSDSLQSVPIKKRRFLRMHPPSPPPGSSRSDDSDYFLESNATSYEDEHHDKEIFPYKRSNSRSLKDEACDAADFSGISILAAAACNSDIVGDILNAGGTSKGDSSNEALSGNVQSHESDSMCEDKEQQFQTSDDLQDKHPSLMSSTSVLSADEVKYDDSKSKMGSLGVTQVHCGKTHPSGRDSRLHWDLNIVMDAWDNSCNEVVNSDPLATDHAEEKFVNSENQVVHNKNPVALEASTDQLDSDCFGTARQHLVPVNDASKQHGGDVLKTEGLEERNMGIVNSVVAKKGEESYSQLGNGFVEMYRSMDVASISSTNSIGETKIVHDQRNNICHAKVSSDADHSCCSLTDLSSAIDTYDKTKTSTALMAKESETSSHLHSGEIVSCDNASHELHLTHGQLISRIFSVEHAHSVGNFKSSSSAPCSSHLEPVSSSKSVINLPSVTLHGNQYPLTTGITERASKESSEENTWKQIETMNGPSSETLLPNDSDIVKVCSADKSSIGSGINPCSSDIPRTKGFVLSSEKELPSQVPCVAKHEMTTADADASDGRLAMSSGVTLVPSGPDSSIHNSPDISVLNSFGKVVAEVDANSVDGSSNLAAADKKILTDTRSVLNDKFGRGHVSYTSGDASVPINGMEKVDLLEDDDSQYEDGEFRESILHSWGDGGADEVETEQVDYESDNQDNELLEAGSSVPPAVPIDSLTCKDSIIVGNEVMHAEKDAYLATFQPFLKCSSTSEAFDTESSKRAAGSVVRNGQLDHLTFVEESTRQQIDNDASRSVTYGANASTFTEDDLAKEAPARMKSSGWDRLSPEGDRCVRVGLDSGVTVKQPHCASFLERSGSSFRRDLSSKVDRFHSDETHKQERSYTRVTRYDDRNSSGTKSDRYIGSSGRDGPSRQGRVRGKKWFDSSNHSGPRHHDSPAFFGASSFEQNGARNAAAAAVAKVESNGFVVAPDGTIVKASSAGPGSRMPKRSANGPLQSSHCTVSDRRSSCETEHPSGIQRGLARPRDITPDRHFDIDRGRSSRYAQEMVRGRYQKPVPDDRAELVMHHLSRSDRSFYPRRGPLRNSRSRTRSGSRSRTRSPRPWTPPRGSGVGLNGGLALLRRSRSPKFRSNGKMGRATSPRHRPSFEYRIAGYGPTARTQVSPNASRWADKRQVSPEQHREHEYKRHSGRSTDLRMMRNNRFDSVISHVRSKPVVQYRHFHSSRVAEVGGFGRGSRHDGVDDRRGHGDRFDITHSMRQYGMDSNEKSAHYDLEKDFQAHKSSPRSTAFRQSGSPRAFDRGIHHQVGDSPSGAKEKGHFGYDK